MSDHTAGSKPAVALGSDGHTLPADPAAALSAVLNDRDQIRYLWEGLHCCLVHELLRQPGSAVDLDLVGRAQACVEASDLAADEALRLLQAWVTSLGGVVDVATNDNPADPDDE